MVIAVGVLDPDVADTQVVVVDERVLVRDLVRRRSARRS
jgi:hypothetical protein